MKNVGDIILILATFGALYNFFRSIKYKHQSRMERMFQYFLTNNMIENRNRFVQIIKANHALMKFTHENLTRYKSDILENAFEDDSEVPEEFTKRLDTVLDELQNRITKLEIGEMTGDLKEDMTYEEVVQLAMKQAKEAKK